MLLLGAIIFIAYLYFVGFWQIVDVISSLDLRLAIAAVLIDLACIGFFALSWQLLLEKPGLGFGNCLRIVLVSIFGDLMIPTASISGELLRINLTMKKSSLNAGQVTASVLLHRLLLGITFGGILGFSIILLIVTQAMQVSALYIFVAIGAIDMALGVLGAYALYNVNRFKGLLKRVVFGTAGFLKLFKSSYDPEKAYAKLVAGCDSFHCAIVGINRLRLAASSAILALRWFTIALIPYLMFYSLNYEVSYWLVLTVSIFVSMVQMVPIGIPGLMGVMEVSMTAFFLSFGIPANIAASATILTRLVLFWFELLLSAVAASYQGVSSMMKNGKR